MKREARLALVGEAVAKFDTIRPTVSTKAIAEEIVSKWEESERAVKDQIHRYFVARYGKGYVYQAPETFNNALEQWMLFVAAGNMEGAEERIVAIEEHWRNQ